VSGGLLLGAIVAYQVLQSRRHPPSTGDGTHLQQGRLHG
jgi:hypothetical protein